MGLDGLILRKKDKMNLEETKKLMSSILDKLGYYYGMSEKNKRGRKFYTCGVSEYQGSEKGFVMYLYGEQDPFDEGQFDFIECDLGKVLHIEDISGSEDMILKILYEYFKVNPNDYFYNILDWYYTKKEIDRIYNSDDWEDWPYKNPN